MLVNYLVRYLSFKFLSNELIIIGDVLESDLVMIDALDLLKESY